MYSQYRPAHKLRFHLGERVLAACDKIGFERKERIESDRYRRKTDANYMRSSEETRKLANMLKAQTFQNRVESVSASVNPEDFERFVMNSTQ